MRTVKTRWRFLDALWLTLLMSYILAGTPDVPFHGDESTTLWMSRDYGYMFLNGDLERVRYSETPLSETEQHLRLITGSLTKYLMGLSWAMNGYSTSEINEQWDWGAEWDYNHQFGHAPDDTLLMLGRWPSALMLALGAIVIFLIGHFLSGYRAAYFASLYYALSPGLLLNGRRAMFEGGLVFFSLLTLLAGLWFLRRPRWWKAILLGLASGLAVSAKHPAAFTVMAVFTGIFFEFTIGFVNQPEKRRLLLTTLVQVFAAGFILLLVFYLMNPVWWGDPIRRTNQVLEARSGILSGQVATFGGYESLMEQLDGMFRQMLIANPQYFEVPGWDDYLATQIDRYESSPWRGVSIGGSGVGTVVLVFVLGVGIWRIMRQLSMPHIRLFAVWSGVILVTSGLIVPIEWQRYYLMTYPLIGLAASIGVVTIWDQFIRYQRKVSSAFAS